MQKKIIALAIAGLASTAAFAQTNVTIYGVADAYVGYINSNAGNRANTQPEAHGRDTVTVASGGLSGSRLGFKGTEDLGNGLKAVFALEYGLDIVNNVGVGVGNAQTGNTLGGAGSARQQYVGLNGGFGTVSFGRQYAPGYAASLNDASGYAVLSSKAASQAYLGGTIVGGANARWDNSISYMTNNIGGFTAQVIYQGGAQANELSTRESYGIGASYAAGPVSVNYVYQNAKTFGSSTTTAQTGVNCAVALVAGDCPAGQTVVVNTTTTALVADGARLEEHYIGGSFDAKVVKVFASFQTMDQGDKFVAGLGNKGHAYNIGVIVPVGKGNIHAGYALADKNSNGRAGSTYRGQQETLNLIYTHGLSKRTTLYTGVTYNDNDTIATGSGITTTVAAGINHAF